MLLFHKSRFVIQNRDPQRLPEVVGLLRELGDRRSGLEYLQRDVQLLRLNSYYTVQL